MKKTIIIIISLLSAQFAFAQAAVHTSQLNTESCALTVEVSGLDSDDGQLMIAIYDNEATWLKKPYLGKIALIENGSASVTFEMVPYGVYAISSYHDENSNGDLDLGLFGIPKEPYAQSRGAKNMFGPPKWKNAIFELNSLGTTEAVKY